MRVLRGVAVGAAVLSLNLAFSCRSATQIRVEVRTDLGCDLIAARGVSIVVATDEGARMLASAETKECNGGEIGSLVVVPRDNATEVVFIEALAGVDRNAADCLTDPNRAGCISSRKRVAFIEHQSLTVEMRLERACAGVSCPNGTCEAGRCVGVDGDAGVDAGVVCAAGRGDCDGDPSNGCEADLAVNARHCGACAHDCLEDACNDGTCTLRRVVGVTNPRHIAVDGEALFVTVGPPSRVLAPGVFAVGRTADLGDIVTSPTHLYWSSSAGLERCERPSCANLESLAVPGTPADAIAVTSNAYYFNDQFNQYIARRSLPAHAETTVSVIAGSLRPPMIVDETDVYWIEWGGKDSVRRCPHLGCPSGVYGVPLTEAPDGIFINGLAVDATHLYWTERGVAYSNVKRRAKDLAGGVEVLTADTIMPNEIALDGPFLYWVDRGVGEADGRVLRIAKTGGPILVLAKAQAKPFDLAVAGGRVYWTNRVQQGSVMSVAK